MAALDSNEHRARYLSLVAGERGKEAAARLRADTAAEMRATGALA